MEFDPLMAFDYGGVEPYQWDNASFYSELRNSRFTVNHETSLFKFIYLNATHYPYMIDENANPVPEAESSDLQAARGTFKI